VKTILFVWKPFPAKRFLIGCEINWYIDMAKINSKRAYVSETK
jgi:hypothetical protein